jgi:hypothetical protein
MVKDPTRLGVPDVKLMDILQEMEFYEEVDAEERIKYLILKAIEASTPQGTYHVNTGILIKRIKEL